MKILPAMSRLRWFILCVTVIALFVAVALQLSGSYDYQHWVLHRLRALRTDIFHSPVSLWRTISEHPLPTVIAALILAILFQLAPDARRQQILHLGKTAATDAIPWLAGIVTKISWRGLSLLLTVSLLILIIGVIASDWLQDPVVIDLITVPTEKDAAAKANEENAKTKDLTPPAEEGYKGYTSQIVTGRIYDELKEIERSSRWYVQAHAKKGKVSLVADLPDIKIPEINLSYRAVIGFIEGFLGIQPRHVSGEITVVADAPSASNSNPSIKAVKKQQPGNGTLGKHHLLITVRVTRMENGEDLPLSLSDVSPDDPEAAIRQAAEAIFHLINPHVLAIYADGGYGRAIADYNEAINIDRTDADAYYNRAVAHYLQDDLAGAIADYGTAISFKPTFADAYSGLCYAYERQGGLQDALAECSRAVRFNPRSADAYNDRGYAQYLLHEYKGAIADYDQAIRLDPKFCYAFANRGDAFRDKHNYARAIADYDEAARLDRGDAFVFDERGNAYLNKRDYSRARADYARAIRLGPTYAAFHLDRGDCYFDIGDYSRANADYEEAVSLDNEMIALGWGNGDTYDRLGNAYYDMYDYKRAAANYGDAIRNNNADTYAYYSLGRLELDLGDSKDAMALFGDAIRFIPKYEEAHYGLGLAYSYRGEYERAVAEHSTAIQIVPRYAAAYGARGYAYFRKGDYDSAIADYDRAIEIDDKNPDYYAGRGDAYYDKGNKDSADTDYEAAAKLYLQGAATRPQDPEALNGAAGILASCPEASIRDGKSAVQYAKKACALVHQQIPNYLDTLASAYAETGDFDDAVKTEEQALALVAGGNADYSADLKLYEQHKPYRSNMW